MSTKDGWITMLYSKLRVCDSDVTTASGQALVCDIVRGRRVPESDAGRELADQLTAQQR